jgi:hypothetical protein
VLAHAFVACSSFQTREYLNPGHLPPWEDERPDHMERRKSDLFKTLLADNFEK